MANKAISELPQAQNVNNQDLFVLEQSGIAKKLTAETFITEQGIIDALAEALDGHGGIQSVTLSSVSGRIRTYRITFSDGSATTFQVYDGTSIERISRTSSSGLQDVYTIFMSDGTTTFFTVTNGADGTVSEAMLNDALKDKAPAITETTESSAIANFTDGADNMVMHNVIAEINPVQSGSGDPSPDNIRPISGWTGCNVTRTGKNLINLASQYSIAANSTWLNDVGVNIPAGTFTFSYEPSISTNQITFSLFNEDGDRIYHANAINNSAHTLTFTISETATKMRSYSNAALTITKLQIEVGSTATAYEPYITPSTVSLSWQTEAGTVYGGTIDVATGLLTVDRAMVDLGTLSYSLWNTSSSRDCYSVVLQDIRPMRDANDNLPAISSIYVATNYNATWKPWQMSYTNQNQKVVFMTPHDEYTDADAFKTAMSEVQLVYELANPQTYQLTPQQLMTLLGTNNVWADTGDVSVTYAADTKMFIEKLTMPTEDDLVANQAITSGKYFMIGNSLYLALANIASGAQITIGTNAQRVSLADALNTINS